MYWQQVLSRLNGLGLLLLVLGAVACTQAAKMVRNERLVTAIRFAGLALAIAGAVILLDLIPGL